MLVGFVIAHAARQCCGAVDGKSAARAGMAGRASGAAHCATGLWQLYMQETCTRQGVLYFAVGRGVVIGGVGVPSEACKVAVVLHISEGLSVCLGTVNLKRGTWLLAC